MFWNHPGWKQPGRKAKWYDEQQEAFTNGWLHGIEILNGPDYELGSNLLFSPHHVLYYVHTKE